MGELCRPLRSLSSDNDHPMDEEFRRHRVDDRVASEGTPLGELCRPLRCLSSDNNHPMDEEFRRHRVDDRVASEGTPLVTAVHLPGRGILVTR